MDENLRDVLIAGVTVFGGFATAVVVSAIAADRERDLEGLRWRRALYAEALRIETRIREAVNVGKPYPEIDMDLGRLLEIHFEVVLLRSEMQNVTAELYEQSKNLVDAAWGERTLFGSVEAAASAASDASMNFRRFASKDLGTNRARRWPWQRSIHQQYLAEVERDQPTRPD